MTNGVYSVDYKIGEISLTNLKKLNLYYYTLSEAFKNLQNSSLKNCSFSIEGFIDYNKDNFSDVINEMRKVMIVGLYHLWEKDIKTLLLNDVNNQSISAKKIEQWSFGDIVSLFKFVSDDTKHFIDIFDLIKKYSTLTNAIKHGEGNAMNKLKNGYPEFISRKTSDIFIEEVHLQEFYETLVQFWESNPDSIVFDYEGFKNATK